jgi:hypothetical protein
LKPYGVHPALAYQQKILDNLEAGSGRSLEQWLLLVAAQPAELKHRQAWLKAQGLGTGQAGLVAERSLGAESSFPATPEAYLAAAGGYVDAMFAGPKAGLRPLYEALLELALGLGPEVAACPCQTIVPLYRKRVFAQLKPSTRTRLDLGLALGEREATGRLIDTGGFAKKDRITHRIGVSAPADLDAELRGWLQLAYDLDGR